MPGGISVTGAFIRMALAILLVLVTFNPTGYSLFHWISGAPVSVTPGKVLAVLALGIGWLICLRTAFIAMGRMGLLLGVALFGVLVWFLVDQRVISLTGTGIVWVGLLVVGLLLGLGLSWSLLRAKATGQVEVN
ncbi:MAG: DUF6524 family protein [Vicinamibacterales bacterium]